MVDRERDTVIQVQYGKQHRHNHFTTAVLAVVLSCSLGATALTTSTAVAAQPSISSSSVDETSDIKSTIKALREAAAYSSNKGDEDSSRILEQYANTLASASTDGASSSSTATVANPLVESKGLKSSVVKLALKAAAKLVRVAPDAFINLTKEFLDRGAETAIRKNSGRIADVIDKVADLPNVATHSARQMVYRELVGSLGSGTAEVIANAVEGAIWLLL